MLRKALKFLKNLVKIAYPFFGKKITIEINYAANLLYKILIYIHISTIFYKNQLFDKNIIRSKIYYKVAKNLKYIMNLIKAEKIVVFNIWENLFFSFFVSYYFFNFII